MFSINFHKNIIVDVKEVDIDLLKCHEHVVENRLNSFIKYLKSLEDDIFISSLIVCNQTLMIVDGHHRYHALKKMGIKNIPVTLIDYGSIDIKAYFDDRISKKQVLNTLFSNHLLPPKSTKHVVWDNKSKIYKPILLLSSIWHYDLCELKNRIG